MFENNHMYQRESSGVQHVKCRIFESKPLFARFSSCAISTKIPCHSLLMSMGKLKVGGSGKNDTFLFTVSCATVWPNVVFEGGCSDALTRLAFLGLLFLIWRVVLEPDCASILFIYSGSRFTHFGCDRCVLALERRKQSAQNTYDL
jgi:hypothetical protein